MLTNSASTSLRWEKLPEAADQQIESGWHVYIIRCSDDSLYTGITTDVERRFRQHAMGKGARYFRGRLPMQVIYQECGFSRSSATAREARIKKLSRSEKLLLVGGFAI